MRFFLTGYIHLYFIFILFQLFVIYAVFKSYISKHLNSFLALSFIISFCTYLFLDITVWENIWAEQYVEWNFLRIFIPWIFFFVLGIKLGYSNKLFKTIENKFFYILLILGSVSFVIYTYEMVYSGEILGSFPRGYFFLGGFFYQCFIALFFILLIKKIYSTGTAGKIKQYFINSGKDTFAIYLSELLVRSALTVAVLNYIYSNVTLYTIIGTVLTWIIIQALVKLIRKSGLSKLNQFLFGGR